MLNCGLLYLMSKASRKARILLDLVKCKTRKLLKTKLLIFILSQIVGMPWFQFCELLRQQEYAEYSRELHRKVEHDAGK